MVVPGESVVSTSTKPSAVATGVVSYRDNALLNVNVTLGKQHDIPARIHSSIICGNSGNIFASLSAGRADSSGSTASSCPSDSRS